jgi:hypothetical protein
MTNGKKSDVFPRGASVALLLAALVAAPLAYGDLGEIITPVKYKSPCAFSNRIGAGSSTWEIIIGNFRGNISSAETYANAFFDNDAGDCGYGDHAAGITGTGITPGTAFTIRVESGIALDTSASTFGTVKFELHLWRYTASNCTGTATDLGALSKTFTFTSSPTYDWKEVDPWDASLSYGDNVGTAGTTLYWKYTMITTTTLDGMSPVTSATQTGCFDVKAEP